MKKRKIKFRKKAISPLIATVLLIGFVVALVALVMTWGKHYIEEKAAKEGAISQEQLSCATDVEVTVNDAYQQGNLVFVTIENLRSNTVDGFIYQVKNGEVESVEVKKSLGPLEIKTISAETTLGSATQVKVIPTLKLARGVPYLPCSEQYVLFKIS